jgi:hypothetical protein
LLPDGETLVNGATVYVASDALFFILQLNEDLSCATPSQNHLVVACTDDQGAFVLKSLTPDHYQIQVERGAFKTQFDVDARSAVGEIEVGAVVLQQPNGSAAAAIALVTGEYDHMENVLAKSGFGDLDAFGNLIPGSERFDIFDGTGYLNGSYPQFSALFDNTPNTGAAKIYDYDIVFINCGAEEDPNFFEGAVKPDDANVAAILRDYVQKGGRLYATDWAYDYIEQAFPEFLDFYGVNTDASEPERLDMAQVGDDEIILENAEVLDNDLKVFLANSTCSDRPSGNCLNPNGGLYIEGFLDSWAVLEGAHTGVSGVKLYTRGEITIAGGEPLLKPLTASFAFGAGYVFYSSYHSEDLNSPGLLPQERVLQYLIFE